MTTQQIFCAIEQGVATITLDNPPVNVVTLTLSRQLGQTLDALAANDEVRAVICEALVQKPFAPAPTSESLSSSNSCRRAR